MNQRTFSSPTTYDFGRVLLGSSLNSGTLNVTTSGLHAVTADSTLAAYSGSAINGLSASGAATLADGSSSPFNIGRTISGTLSGTAGTLTGTFNMDATDEFSNTITNAANVSYTVNGVNQRTITDGVSTSLGRVLNGTAVNVTSNAFTTIGLNATTTSVQVAGNPLSGSPDANGITLSGSATNFTGLVLNESATRTFGGTFTGTGVQTGSFTLGVTTLENGGLGLTGETAYGNVTVAYSVNGVNQRTFSSPTTYDFGRVLLGSSLNSGTLNVTTSGLHAVTADSTLAAYSGSAINGLSASGAATLADGSSSPFNIGRTISGTLSGTAGTLTGTFNMDATDEFSNTITNAANVSYTVNGVNQRTITDGLSTSLGRVLNGTAVNVTSNAFTTIGLNATTTSVQVAGNPLSGSPDANGITLSGSATNFTGLVLNESATRTFGGTFTGTGVQTGSFTLGVTTLENGGLGLTGETAYGNVTVAYSVNGVNQRTFSSPTTYDFGRVLLGSSLNSGTLNVTTSGLHAVTADSTLAAYSGSAINGLSASGAATLADGSSSPFNIGRTISGTLSGTAGTLTGTFNMDATDEFSNTITNAANVSYTVNGVNQRTITDGLSTSLGRVLNGTAVNVTSNAFTTVGLNATTTSVQVAGNPLSGSPDANGITLSGSATNFTGLVLNESATRTFGGTFTGTGVQSGSFTLGVTTLENGGLGLTGETAYGNVTVAYSANVLNQRSFTVGTDPIALGLIHFGAASTGAVSDTAISSLGLHAVTADASLGAFLGTNTNGLTLTTSDSTTFNGGTASQTANYTIGGTVTAGVLSSASFSSAVTAELGTISNVVVNVSGSVFNGNAKWTGAGASWGSLASANWVDSNGINAAPGTFSGFLDVDSATFDNTGTANLTASLNGTSPSLKALSFDSSSSYTLAQGSSGSLILKSNAVDATITDLAGSHLISASLVLASNTTATVTNLSDTLTISSGISESGIPPRGLTKDGAGTLVLSGSSSYTGATTVSNGTLTLKNGSASPSTATLSGTAITVASGATLAVSTVGANIGTNKTVTIDNFASVILAAGATLDLRDSAIGTFNISAPTGVVTQFSSAAASSNLYFDIGQAGLDRINVSGLASITGGTINLNFLSGSSYLTTGVIPLITSNGGFTGVGTNNFTYAGPASVVVGGQTYNLSVTGTTTQTSLNIALVAPTSFYWAGAVNANWDTMVPNVTNWRTDATNNFDTTINPGPASDVFFNTTSPVAANLVNNLNTPFSIKSLTFSSASTTPVTIGDGGNGANVLTVGTGGITVSSGAAAHTVSANVSLGANQTWTNNSTSTLTVSGSFLSAGTRNLIFDGIGNISTGAATIYSGSGTVTKNGSGTTTLAGANLYTGVTSINSGTLAVPQGFFGAGGTITLADNPSVVLLAGGSITRQITALGLGDQGSAQPLNGTLRASANLTVGNAANVFEFNGTVDTQGNAVTIVTAEPTFNATSGVGKGYRQTGPFSVRSVRMGDGGILSNSSTLYFPDATALAPGSTGIIYATGNGTTTVNGNVFGGTNGGSNLYVVGQGAGGITNFTGIVYGGINGDGQTVNITGSSQQGFSPTFSKFNAGGSAASPTTFVNSPVQAGVRGLSLDLPNLTYVAGSGYSSMLNYVKTGVTPADYSISGTVTLADDQAPTPGASSGDTIYVLRTDGHLWPSQGPNGAFTDGSVGGTLPTIVTGTGYSANGLNMHSDIVLGTAGFIRAWFGDVTPLGSGVWKNGSATNNWSSNTAVDSGWGGTAGTVSPGFGKPGDAGHIATFNSAVLSYNSGNVNQDITGLIIGGINLSAQSGSNGYTIGTGTPGGVTAKQIIMDNGSLDSPITVNSGVHTVQTPLSLIGKGLAVNVVNAPDKVTLNGDITSGATSAFTGAAIRLVKDGAGTAVLNGTNTYSGATTVNAGTLEVNGTTGASTVGALTVGASATLAGAGGTISGTSATHLISGTVSPGQNGGSGLGPLAFQGNLTFNPNSNLNFLIGSPATPGTTYDTISGTGTLTLDALLNVNVTGFDGGYAPSSGDFWTLLDWTTITPNSFNPGVSRAGGLGGTLTLPNLTGGLFWDVSTFTSNGRIAVVPEPSRMLLMFFGLAALFLRRRRNGSAAMSASKRRCSCSI